VATYYITQVQLAPSGGARPHHHIESVKLSDGQHVTRSAVATAIRNGEIFYTLPPAPAPQARVYVMRFCPVYGCVSTDYITTHPDDTTKNNLLHLRQF
jgi:hypothetical protein